MMKTRNVAGYTNFASSITFPDVDTFLKLLIPSSSVSERKVKMEATKAQKTKSTHIPVKMSIYLVYATGGNMSLIWSHL